MMNSIEIEICGKIRIPVRSCDTEDAVEEAMAEFESLLSDFIHNIDLSDHGDVCVEDVSQDTSSLDSYDRYRDFLMESA